MVPTDTMTRGAPPALADGAPPSFAVGDPPDGGPPGLDPDRQLIEGAAVWLVAENRARAGRLEAVSRFHANRIAELETRGRTSGFFAMTPLQATVAEFAPLFAVSEMSVQINLDITDAIKRWFPKLWGLCLEGRLGYGRAQLCYEQLSCLTSEEDKAAYAELVQDYFDQTDDPASPIFPVGRTKLQRAVRRRCQRFPQKDEQSSFAEAFKKRRVSVRLDDSGMATVWASTAAHSAQAADYRLTLIAKKLGQADGDTRTLDQLRSDALIDLLYGRLTVGASDVDLEDDEMPDGSDPGATFSRRESVGSFARPIINVTVPISTLLGVGEEPGVLSGGASLPVELVRQIALEPGSTWYRMLTDKPGRFKELSTDSYAATAPIWRWTTAAYPCCIWPGCSTPSTRCDCDHRTPAPEGPTCTCNLAPLCRRHHGFKHSEGVRVVRNDDGSHTWTTRFGSTFRTPAPTFPTDDTDGTDGESSDAGSAPSDAWDAATDREFWSIMEQQHSHGAS